MDFKHIIWDFDGTLFDTYPQTAKAFQILLRREYGVMENVSEIEEQMRLSMHSVYKFYKEKYDIDNNFINTFKEYRILYENQNALPFNNVFMLCKFIFEQGGFNYLVTDRDNSVISMLQKHGLYEIFKDFVTAENKLPVSPCADALVHIIDKYEINKRETLFIGDTRADAEAAKRAGIFFCYYTRDVNKNINGDYTVQNFSDLYYIINSTLTTKKSDV